MPSSINIWRLSLIPEKAIDEKIQRLHQQSKTAKRNNLHGKEAKAFEDKLLRLFDIIACKCEIINCGGGPACRRMHWLPCAVQMSSWEKDSRDWSRVHQRSKRKTWFAGRKGDTGRKRCERLEKKREEKEEKKAMKEMKRAEAAAKVDENQEYQKEKGVRQQDGNPWWSKRQLWQFGCRQQWLWIQGTQRNTDRTTIKIDLFASEAVRFGVSDRATAALWNCLSVRQC